MKYNEIKIVPNRVDWEIEKIIDPIERKRVKTKPSHFGFYHFEETIPFEDAFEKLKKVMVKKLKNEILHLEKSLKSLEQLDFK